MHKLDILARESDLTQIENTMSCRFVRLYQSPGNSFNLTQVTTVYLMGEKLFGDIHRECK
jgi:hypothetical protein